MSLLRSNSLRSPYKETTFSEAKEKVRREVVGATQRCSELFPTVEDSIKPLANLLSLEVMRGTLSDSQAQERYQKIVAAEKDSATRGLPTIGVEVEWFPGEDSYIDIDTIITLHRLGIPKSGWGDSDPTHEFAFPIHILL